MSQARLLLLCMQRRFSSLRFYPTCDCEKAGDVVESTGGILSPWRVSAGVVVRYLANLFGLSRDDVLGAVEADVPDGGLAGDAIPHVLQGRETEIWVRASHAPDPTNSCRVHGVRGVDVGGGLPLVRGAEDTAAATPVDAAR